MRRVFNECLERHGKTLDDDSVLEYCVAMLIEDRSMMTDVAAMVEGPGEFLTSMGLAEVGWPLWRLDQPGVDTAALVHTRTSRTPHARHTHGRISRQEGDELDQLCAELVAGLTQVNEEVLSGSTAAPQP